MHSNSKYAIPLTQK